jgi:hypothetical protein
LVRPKSGKFVSLFLVFYIGGYVSAFLPPADELLPGQLSYLEEMGQEFPIDLSGGVVVSDDEVKDGAQDEV